MVDRQLQEAIKQMDHKEGFIKVMDDSCNAHDLKKALESNTKYLEKMSKCKRIFGR